MDAAGDSATTTAAGADSTGGTGSEDAGGDACDIVSDEVAAEVLGVEIVRREPGGESGSESVSCIKGSERAADPADFSFVSVGVVAGTLTLVDQMGAQAGSVPVAGLGDRAVYLPSVGGVFIADGSDSIQVQVVQAGVPGGQEDCVTVANDVLERRS